MRIGILALQGAFAEHKIMLEGLGAECFEIRQLKDLYAVPVAVSSALLVASAEP